MTPAVLGRYRILKRLAAGGMGEVYLARQEGPAGFARPVVLKRVLAHLVELPGFIDLFLAEARLAAVLSHPNIVQIIELGQADGTWFLAMEYLVGRSLQGVLNQVRRTGERMDPLQAARIASQALQGLHYAHFAKNEDGQPLNIVHRDVSPDNVFVCFNGAVKVLDFGIAKAASGLRNTKAGEVRGKYEYMAPEQLRGEPLDGRADVYAVGIVLYELLAGDKPFEGLAEAAAMHHTLSVAPPPLDSRAPQAPPELCRLVMKALEKDPAARWQTAEAFSLAIDHFIASAGGHSGNASTAGFMSAVFPEDKRPDPFAEARLAAAATPAPPPAPPPAPAPIPLTYAVHEAPREFVLAPAVDAAPLELARQKPIVDAAPAPPARGKGPLIAALLAFAVIASAAGWYLLKPRPSPDINIVVGMLVVDSDPPGATLKIDGDVVGKTPWSGSNAWAGDVAYEVTAPGRNPAHGTFHGGGDVTLHAKLPRK